MGVSCQTKQIKTAGDVVQHAIALTGIHPAAEPIPAAMMADGLAILNDILDEWGGSGLTIPYQSELTFDLSIGQACYAVGESVANAIQSAEIIQVLAARVQWGNDCTALRIAHESEYDRLLGGIDDTLMRPRAVALRRFAFYSELAFDALPDKPYSTTLTCKQRLKAVDLGQPLTEIPRHYLRALTYQVVLGLAAIYGVSLSPWFEQRADLLLRQVLAVNAPDLAINLQECRL